MCLPQPFGEALGFGVHGYYGINGRFPVPKPPLRTFFPPPPAQAPLMHGGECLGLSLALEGVLAHERGSGASGGNGPASSMGKGSSLAAMWEPGNRFIQFLCSLVLFRSRDPTWGRFRACGKFRIRNRTNIFSTFLKDSSEILLLIRTYPAFQDFICCRYR